MAWRQQPETPGIHRCSLSFVCFIFSSAVCSTTRFFVACLEAALSVDPPIHLALLVPLSGPWVLRGAGAAALAVETINADISLLPGRLAHSFGLQIGRFILLF